LAGGTGGKKTGEKPGGFFVERFFVYPGLGGKMRVPAAIKIRGFHQGGGREEKLIIVRGERGLKK